MTLGDSHVHSSFSTDSETPMEENVLAAIEKGLPWICMTDHVDYDYPVDNLTFEFDMDEYFDYINELREKYGGRIQIYAGVELGMQPHLKDRYEALIKAYPFDFCLASQHLVNGCDPYYPTAFEGRTDRDVYRAYFEETLENIRSFHSFDSLAHLDYIIRYGKERRRYRYSEFADVLDEILKTILKYNIALEVNTAGVRKRLGAPNPQLEVLRRYRELGGTLVTIGSDSHKAYSLGYAFDSVSEMLRSVGFTHIACYVARHPKFVKL